MLPVTCHLIGLGTSINFFIVVFGRAFNVLLGKRYVLSFELNITVNQLIGYGEGDHIFGAWMEKDLCWADVKCDELEFLI